MGPRNRNENTFKDKLYFTDLGKLNLLMVVPLNGGSFGSIFATAPAASRNEVHLKSG